MKNKKTKVSLFFCMIFVVVGVIVIFWNELGIQEIPLATLQEKYEKKESKYITVNGTSIHYCDEGKGPAIVALHGIADSLHTWDEWAKEMTSRYRIVRMDIPGFGLTGPVKDGVYSKEMFIGFLDKFLTELKIENCILVGNSLGGAIAWNYALQFPQKVNQLILIDPAGYPMEIPWPLNLAETPGVRHVARLITPRWIFQMSINQVFADSSKVTSETVDRFYELALRPGNREALVKIMAALTKLNHDPAFSKSITNISVPTLLMWGKKDIWIPVSHVSKWKQDVHDIQTILYENAGHVPHLEIPGRVATDMHQWISMELTKKQDNGLIHEKWFIIVCGMFLFSIFFLYVIRK
jgi:pimeloyl-ACP methyl ester carboxylesterase